MEIHSVQHPSPPMHTVNKLFFPHFILEHLINEIKKLKLSYEILLVHVASILFQKRL
jgi:hypothetical protein